MNSLTHSDRILAKMHGLRNVQRAADRGLTLSLPDAERQALAGIARQRLVGCDPTAPNGENGTVRLIPVRVQAPPIRRPWRWTIEAGIAIGVGLVIAWILSVTKPDDKAKDAPVQMETNR